jgi:hypothetical protein
MEALHTFTFVKWLVSYSDKEWTSIDALTSTDVMPFLRRMNFAVLMDADDLLQMSRSALFTDCRHSDRSHQELDEYVPRGSQCNIYF